MARVLGAALRFLANRFGGLLREVETTPVIGTTAQLILGFDAERVSVTFVNLSANTIYIGPKSDVSIAKGILINPSGGAVAINVEEDGSLPTNEWYARATAAASGMYVLVVKRDTALPDEGGES